MKKYILLALLSLSITAANAQRHNQFFINYLPSIPLGETADFTGGISPRGIDFEANHFLSDDISVGVNLAWTVFRENISDEILQVGDLDISGIQFRYQNIVPLTVNVKKYFIGETMMPYLGLGTGIQYAEQRNDIGVFSVTDDKWQFTFAPEVGMLYDLSYSAVLSVKLKYNYAFKANDFPATSYLSLGIGIGLN